jgi:hypothetical protein
MQSTEDQQKNKDRSDSLQVLGVGGCRRGAGNREEWRLLLMEGRQGPKRGWSAILGWFVSGIENKTVCQPT